MTTLKEAAAAIRTNPDPRQDDPREFVDIYCGDEAFINSPCIE